MSNTLADKNGGGARNGIEHAAQELQEQKSRLARAVGSSNESELRLASSLYSDKRESSLATNGGAESEVILGEGEAALVTLAHESPESSSLTQGEVPPQEKSPEKVLDPRPKIPLSGPGRLISDLSRELGQVLAPHGIYSLSKTAVVYNRMTRTLEPLTPVRFRSLMENYVIPIKLTPKGEVEQSMSCGDAGSVLASDQFLDNLREIERLNTVRLPVMRADSRVELLAEGYDGESKVLTAQDGVAYATDMPLGEATAFLDGLLQDFPFADESRSKAVAIAAMLTMVSLELMPPGTILPVFLYRGNVPGLGKGLLAQAAIIPRLDHVPTGSLPHNEEEMRKMLFATAREGRAAVLLDNVTGRLGSPNLEAFVTSSTVTQRVLNHSRTETCRKNTVVFITGNNVSLNGDLCRRTMIVELYLAGDAGDRVIENHLDEPRLRELRPQTLAALYALVREWAVAGKPKPTKINPNFVVWSQVVGGIVEQAGYGSVTALLTVSTVTDPKEADMLKLVEKLYGARRTEALKFQEVVTLARSDGLFPMILPLGADGATRVENTAFSRFLTAQDQRMFPGELRFVIIGKGHARRYALQRLAPQVAET